MASQDVLTEPKIIRKVKPSPAILEALIQTLFWQLNGDRECRAIRRYVYLKDSTVIANQSELTFEEFRSPPEFNEGAYVDGIMVSLEPVAGRTFEDLPITDEEEATEGGYDWEEALEALASYLGDLTAGEAKEVGKILSRIVR